MNTHIPVALKIADARWFPVDLHVPRREYRFLKIDDHVLESSSFLDTRIDASLEQACPLPAEELVTPFLPSVGPGWLFHTSFCCSTLLARLLHLPPQQVVLKEPLVLRRLADARHAQWPGSHELIGPTVSLLARAWHAQGGVVIKPTHAALNIAADLMAASPASRAILLTSSLDDFLVSHLKKSEETLAKIPVLAERALASGGFRGRLPAAAFQPPSFLAAAALQWAAQRELCLDIIDSVGIQRVKVVDASTLLASVPQMVWQVSRWLQLPATAQALATRAAEVSTRNAKAVWAQYDASRRAADIGVLQARFQQQLQAASGWAKEFVLPFMRERSVGLGGEPGNPTW